MSEFTEGPHCSVDLPDDLFTGEPASTAPIVGKTDTEKQLRRIAKKISESACGPLVVAQEVMGLAEEWEKHRADVGGLDATTALKKYLGFNLGWFRARARAVELLGEDIRRWMAHDLAVWVSRCAHESLVLGIKRHVYEQFQAEIRTGQIVTVDKAKSHVYAKLGRTAETRSCKNCQHLRIEVDRLRSVLIAMGYDPDKE